MRNSRPEELPGGTRRALSRVGLLVAAALGGSACSPPWVFRLRERAGAVDDTPRTVVLRCGEAPVFLAVREAGIVTAYGPVAATYATTNLNPLASTSPLRVGEGTWLQLEAKRPASGTWSNGGLCLWRHDGKRDRCGGTRYVLDVVVDCPVPPAPPVADHCGDSLGLVDSAFDCPSSQRQGQ